MIPICIDLETTGLREDAEILQCAIVSARGDILFNRHFCPENVKEWPDAERVNGISPASVSWCPPFSAAREELSRLLSGADLIIGYNHKTFDLPLLERFGVSYNHNALLVDMMQLFAPVYGQERPQGGFKWQKLGTMAQYFCFPYTELHDAVMDCFATLHSFYSFFGAFQFNPVWGTAFFHSMNLLSPPISDVPLRCEEYMETSSSRAFLFEMADGFFPKFTPL